MKIKEGFILREVVGKYIVVAVNDMVKEFNCLIELNETGALLWKALEKGAEKEDLVSALLSEYDCPKEIAEKDVSLFLERLEKASLLA